MRVSVVTDEVSSDLETALEIIRSWEVDWVELRGIGDGRFPDVSPYWRVRLPQLLDEFGLRVAALSPGLFQAPFPQAAPLVHFGRSGDVAAVDAWLAAKRLLEDQLHRLLPESIEAAERLGTKTIICFNFMRMDHRTSPRATDEMIGILRSAAELVGQAGMKLLVEISEPCGRPADMVRRVDHPAIGINWDPASAYIGGDEDVPYPEGFKEVRPYIRHVHFKDARIDPTTNSREWVADGIIDWPGALRELDRDGYDGFISIETHFRPKVAGTKSCLDRVRALLAELAAPQVSGQD